MTRKESLILATLLGTSLLGFGEVEQEFPLGVEVVTGLRTDYVHRGFQLAGSVLDAQIETEYTLQQDLTLVLGGWIASELSGDFSEIGGSILLEHTLTELFTVGGGFQSFNRDNGPIPDEQNLSLYFQFFPNQDWDLKLLASRDFEGNGWYSALEGGWSYRLSDDAFLSLKSGVSWVNNYNQRDGFNDFFGRISFTYLINNSVSVTPFAGWSVLFDDDEINDETDRIYSGLWFEVVF